MNNLLRQFAKSSGQMIGDAVAREKQLTAESRATKFQLIQEFNPLWNDL